MHHFVSRQVQGLSYRSQEHQDADCLLGARHRGDRNRGASVCGESGFEECGGARLMCVQTSAQHLLGPGREAEVGKSSRVGQRSQTHEHDTATRHHDETSTGIHIFHS